jgi:negative regulator of flagellin synthesis FlgM
MTDSISNNVARFAQQTGANKSASQKANAANQQDNSHAATLSASTTGGDKSGSVSNSITLSNVTQKVMAQPSFDRAKVDSIKKAIKDGNYPLNPKGIAESFLSLEQMIKG